MLDKTLAQVSTYLTTLHNKIDALAKRPGGGGATPQPLPYLTSYFCNRYLANGCRFRVNGQAVTLPATITAVTENSVSVELASHGMSDNDEACVLVGNRHAFYGSVTNLTTSTFIITNTRDAVPAGVVKGACHTAQLASFTALNPKPFTAFSAKVPAGFTLTSFDMWFVANSRSSTYIDVSFDYGKPFVPENMYVPMAFGKQALDGMTAFSMGTSRSVAGNICTVRFNPLPQVAVAVYVNVRY